MNAEPLEPRQVPVDVLPPLPHDAYGSVSEQVTPHTPLAGYRTFYHPASGVAILGIDLLLFGPQVIFPFDVPVLCALAFLATFPLVFLIQWKWSGNHVVTSAGKAFMGAFLAGLPFSITGTMFGAAVLALAGLPHNPVAAFKKLTSPQRPPTD